MRPVPVPGAAEPFSRPREKVSRAAVTDEDARLATGYRAG